MKNFYSQSRGLISNNSQRSIIPSGIVKSSTLGPKIHDGKVPLSFIPLAHELQKKNHHRMTMLITLVTHLILGVACT